ncbi:MAG: hypothetical protein V4506_00690 [Bacteroidota bacterium]
MVAEYRVNDMMEKRYKNVKYRDVEKKIEAVSRHEAFVLFENAKKRLNDINNWELLCGKSPAEFQLTDDMGNLLDSSVPQIGNLIKVRLHAPSNGENKYIWYKVEDFIHEKNLLRDTEDFGFNVVQITDPFLTNETNLEGVTCTFLVTRSGCTVSAVEVERTKIVTSTNGMPLFDKIKEKITDAFSLVGSPNPQWKSLVNGVLQY